MKAVVAAVVAVVLALVAALAMFTSGSGNEVASYAEEAACDNPVAQAALGSTVDPGAVSTVKVGDLSPEQSQNARIIIKVGQGKGIPNRGLIVSIATAYQESKLHNLHGGDRDSQGLFQQRPSQGWGTVAQVTNPVYSAGKFFDVLVKVRGWQSMSVTQAAQAVQRSGFPDAYAAWEGLATQTVAAITGSDSAPPAIEDAVLQSDTQVALAVDHGSTTMDGEKISVTAARQIRLAEKLSGIDMRVMQGGYGGHHIAASGSSHNYPGVADISPGSIAVEKILRQVGFAAWARNIPGRSSVGSGAHVHAVSLLDAGDKASPQVFGSWPKHGNGLSGANNDPAPHYKWIPNLAERVGGTPLVADGDASSAAGASIIGAVESAAAQCGDTTDTAGLNLDIAGATLAGGSVAATTSGQGFGFATLNVQGATHRGNPTGRMRKSVALINSHGADVVALQELQSGQAKAFKAQAGGTFGLCTDPGGNTENPVAFRRSVFTLLECKSFDVPYFDGHPKPMAYAKLQYKATGASIWVMSLHNPAAHAGHSNVSWRNAAVVKEIRFWKQLAADGTAVYGAGDMNDHHLMSGAMGKSAMRGVHSPITIVGGIDWILGSPGTKIVLKVVDHGPTDRQATDHPYVQAQVAAPSK